MRKYSAAMASVSAVSALANFGTNVVPKWYEHSTTNNEDVQSSGPLESHVSSPGSVSGDAPIDSSAFGGATDHVTGNIDSDSVSGFSELISSISECTTM